MIIYITDSTHSLATKGNAIEIGNVLYMIDNSDPAVKRPTISMLIY